MTENRHLRDCADLLRSHVDQSLEALDLDPKDAAVAKLARLYADAIDAASGQREHAYVMRWIAPLLLDCLESLGATPVARSKVKGDNPTHGENRLTALRSAHR